MLISANIITYNESKNITTCVNALKDICDEVIVVDSLSTDNTTEIAKSLGAKIVIQEYLGDGQQKNIALDYAKYDWILSIDADEVPDDEMISSILKLKSEKIQEYDAYSFRRKNHIGDRWIKHCGWYPDICTRLYNKNTTKYQNISEHSHVEAENIKELPGNIIHHSFKNYDDLFYKANRHSTRGANILLDKGARVNRFSPIIHGFWAFIKKYFFQRGFIQGLNGLTIALSVSLTSYLKYAKFLEMKRSKSKSKSKSIWKA